MPTAEVRARVQASRYTLAQRLGVLDEQDSRGRRVAVARNERRRIETQRDAHRQGPRPGPGVSIRPRLAARATRRPTALGYQRPQGAGYSSSTSFSRTAYMTASIREWSWSFSSMLRTWFLTVFSLIARRWATSRLLRPLATRRSTSSSRSVSRSACPCARSGRDIVLNSSMSLAAIDGLI